MEFREKRVSPGRGILPGEVMARQRYYEAYGTPYEMGEFYGEDESSEQIGGSATCVGHEVEVLSEIRRTPLPMGRKKRSRELGQLCMSNQQRSHLMSVRARRLFVKLKISLTRRMKRVGSFLSWLLGGWKINRIRESLGTSTASYFVLLKNIYLLNFLLFLFIFCFISIPQLVHWSVATPVPPNFTDKINLVVDGQGQDFEFSILYVGYYHSNTSSILGNVYKFPVVYLVVMFWAIMISFLWLLLGAKGLRFAGQTGVMESVPFTWRVLSSWNYNLHHANTVSEKQANIVKELKGLVREEEASSRKRNLFRCRYVLRVLVSCAILLWIAGGGAAIFFTVQTLRSGTCGVHYLHDDQINSDAISYLLLFRIALVVTALNTIFPFLNRLLISLEFYRSHTRAVITNIRVFVMYLVNMAVLVYSLLSFNAECVCQTSGYCCWETRVGQEIYRLFWIDFLVELLALLVTDIVRGFVVKFRIFCKLSDWIGYQEFNLSNQTLSLMYSQILVWFGMFFCPLLPLVAALRFSLMFLLKTWSTRLTNSPPSLLYHTRANAVYYSTVLLGALLSLMVPLGWTVTQLTPSKSCGPFRHVSHMTDTITNEIHSWTSAGGQLQGFGLFVEGLQSSAIALPLVFLLSLFALYFFTKSKSLEKQAKDLLIQSDADCRNSHSTLLRAVSMIPPYDPVLFDADPTGYGEFMDIHPHNLPDNYPADVVVTEGPVPDYMYYYDEQTHMPRQVHIGGNDIDEPV